MLDESTNDHPELGFPVRVIGPAGAVFPTCAELARAIGCEQRLPESKVRSIATYLSQIVQRRRPCSRYMQDLVVLAVRRSGAQDAAELAELVEDWLTRTRVRERKGRPIESLGRIEESQEVRLFIPEQLAKGIEWHAHPLCRAVICRLGLYDRARERTELRLDLFFTDIGATESWFAKLLGSASGRLSGHPTGRPVPQSKAAETLRNQLSSRYLRAYRASQPALCSLPVAVCHHHDQTQVFVVCGQQEVMTVPPSMAVATPFVLYEPDTVELRVQVTEDCLISVEER